MKRSIIEIYAMAVCFAISIILVITIGTACYNLVQVVYPEFTISTYKYMNHQNNNAFWKYARCYETYYGVSKDKRPSEEELTRIRQEDYKSDIKGESRDGIQKLTRSLFILLFCLAFFSIHWRIARRARETNNAANTA